MGDPPWGLSCRFLWRTVFGPLLGPTQDARGVMRMCGLSFYLLTSTCPISFHPCPLTPNFAGMFWYPRS